MTSYQFEESMSLKSKALAMTISFHVPRLCSPFAVGACTLFQSTGSAPGIWASPYITTHESMVTQPGLTQGKEATSTLQTVNVSCSPGQMATAFKWGTTYASVYNHSNVW